MREADPKPSLPYLLGCTAITTSSTKPWPGSSRMPGVQGSRREPQGYLPRRQVLPLVPGTMLVGKRTCWGTYIYIYICIYLYTHVNSGCSGAPFLRSTRLSRSLNFEGVHRPKTTPPEPWTQLEGSAKTIVLYNVGNPPRRFWGPPNSLRG